MAYAVNVHSLTYTLKLLFGSHSVRVCGNVFVTSHGELYINKRCFCLCVCVCMFGCFSNFFLLLVYSPASPLHSLLEKYGLHSPSQIPSCPYSSLQSHPRWVSIPLHLPTAWIQHISLLSSDLTQYLLAFLLIFCTVLTITIVFKICFVLTAAALVSAAYIKSPVNIRLVHFHFYA